MTPRKKKIAIKQILHKTWLYGVNTRDRYLSLSPCVKLRENPPQGVCRAEVSLLLIGSNWKWLLLKKLLCLPEPNPVEILREVNKQYSVRYVLSVKHSSSEN